MSIVQTQIQTQKQEQQLKMSMQQLQVVKLLGLSIGEFEEHVKKEIVENPALEEGSFDLDDDMGEKDVTSPDEIDINDSGDDPYSDTVDEEVLQAMENYGDDDLPVYASDSRSDARLGDDGSFIEDLEAQMMSYELDETQQEVMRYLIGLLDNRGYIDTPLPSIVEELAFKFYIYVDEAYVAEVLNVLKSFDPPGIGAKDTQECLLLQIDRQLNGGDLSEYKERFLQLQHKVVADYYDIFIKQNHDKLKVVLGVSDMVVSALIDALKKLNVNPGLSLGESSGSRVETQIPDFIVETDPEGNISLRLNSGDIPRIHVRRDYINQLRAYNPLSTTVSRSEREGMEYTRQKVEAAQMFIESVKQRRRTLYETMRAIIELQRPFFLSRDENDKVRMVLKDVARKSGYDVSTVSRVCGSKCCLLDGRIYRLSEFFKLTRKNAEGEDVDGKIVAAKLKAIIDSEDKSNPYNDDQLAEMLSVEGIKLARRTIAKYRKEMGIPSLINRKE